jgi:hypothetical protein
MVEPAREHRLEMQRAGDIADFQQLQALCQHRQRWLKQRQRRHFYYTGSSHILKGGCQG